jgi:hypothetical protein
MTAAKPDEEQMPWETYTVRGMPERGVSFVQIPAELGDWAVMTESTAKALWTDRKRLEKVIKEMDYYLQPEICGDWPDEFLKGFESCRDILCEILK